jgi:hypothetical protein
MQDKKFFNTAQSQGTDTCSFKKIFPSTFLNLPSMCCKFHNVLHKYISVERVYTNKF